MEADRHVRFSALVLLLSASLWGLSWWPLQRLAAGGVQGPALAMLTYGFVGLCGLPWLWGQRAHWLHRPGLLLWMMLVGGWAAASFVMMLAIGDVVREMLLFYLAPAWSILGARFLLKERVGLRRALGLAMALGGAFLVIRAAGPLRMDSLSLADGLALSSGMAFAANNLTARVAAAVPVTTKVVASMLGCALLSALTMLAIGQPMPSMSTQVGLGVLGFALLWTFAGTWTTSYGVTHLPAGRAALIILSELVVALFSASVASRRIPSALEVAGSVLILAAAVVDAKEH
jgi:drug/metabolite transporter (DMT)-like permease